MSYLLASVEKPVKFINAGIFKAVDDSFRHQSRVISSFELIYVISGVLYLGEEGVEYELEEGDAIILYPHLNHYGYKDSGKDLSFFWSHFLFQNEYHIYDELDQLPGISYYLKNPFHPELNNKILLPKYSQKFKGERLSVLCHELIHINESLYYCGLATNLHMTAFLVELTNQYLNQLIEESRVAGSDVLISYIIQYIGMNYHKKFTKDEISMELGYNYDYLARLFKKKMGMKISNYINYIRIEKAKKLLLETVKTIKEISFEVGYDDDKYFMKLFKISQGMTPSDYRKAYYKKHYISK
jgi:AraC-like DNA-binding protein